MPKTIFKFNLRRGFLWLCILSTFSLVLACSSPENGNRKVSRGLLPDAAGEITEILVVIDSTKWAGEVGEFFRNSLGAPIPGLPQDEAQFTLRRIDPFKMNSVLKTARTIIYVTILDDTSPQGQHISRNLNQESKDRIKSDPNLFMLTQKDQFAKGQEIIQLFGTDEDALLVNLYKNKEIVMNHFVQKAKERISDKLYAVGELVNVEKSLKNDHQFGIRIPDGYDIADQKDNFVWIRFLDKEVDKSIIVYYQNYNSEEIFEQENLLKLREKVTRTYLRDIQKPDLYITYQPIFPMKSKAVNWRGEFAMESIGLWRLSDNTLGGPYKSYAFVDESRNRLYYVEGYIMAPGKLKREPLMELEVIMSTFSFAEQLDNENNS